MRGHETSSRTDVTTRGREKLLEAVARATGLRRSQEEIQKKTFEEVPKQVLRVGSQSGSREVLKEVMKGGPEEVAKGDVAKERLNRRSREEVVKGCREKRS